MNLKDLKLVILYGSRAKGTAGEASDTDVAVLAERPLGTGEKLQLVSEVAEKFDFHEDKVQLVDLWEAPPLLRFEAARHGRLLQGEPLDFILFRVSAWKQYQDTAKWRARQREHLKQRIYGQ